MTDKLVTELLWHVEQVFGPISTEVCENPGDDDRSILEHNFRILLTRAADALEPSGDVVERYRHVKRGTIYEVVGRAELQMSFDSLVDGSEMVVYRGDDGKMWVREESEFHDGRFQALGASHAE